MRNAQQATREEVMNDFERPEDTHEIWTPEDVAACVRVTVWHVRHLARQGNIPAQTCWWRLEI